MLVGATAILLLAACSAQSMGRLDAARADFAAKTRPARMILAHRPERNVPR